MSETATTQPGSSHRRRSVWLWVGLAVLGAVLFVVGALVGAALNSHHAQIAAQQAQIRTLQQSLTVARAQRTTAQKNMQAAQTVARSATAAANAKAKADYASRVAAVNKLQREQGIIQASTISADGVYVVGKDTRRAPTTPRVGGSATTRHWAARTRATSWTTTTSRGTPPTARQAQLIRFCAHKDGVG
jgi:hypothetical protein